MSNINHLKEWELSKRLNLSKEELEIIDMLRHYFLFKGYFSENLFMKCMMFLIRGKNPFLYLKIQFKQEAEAITKGRYQISSDVFHYKLKNDFKKIKKGRSEINGRESRN